MANRKNPIENLKGKHHVLTNEERARGGRKSQEKQNLKRTYYDMAQALNERKPVKKNMEALVLRGFKNEEINNQFLFVFSVFQKATKGDVNAMRLWLQMTSQFSEEKESLEVDKLKAEIAKMKAETETATDVEDLTPLATLLGLTNEKPDEE